MSHQQSILKFCWLSLQNMPRAQPVVPSSAYPVMNHLVVSTVILLLLVTSHSHANWIETTSANSTSNLSYWAKACKTLTDLPPISRCTPSPAMASSLPTSGPLHWLVPQNCASSDLPLDQRIHPSTQSCSPWTLSLVLYNHLLVVIICYSSLTSITSIKCKGRVFVLLTNVYCLVHRRGPSWVFVEWMN